MLELFVVVARAVMLALRGHRELVLENLTLRQQLAALRHSRTASRVSASPAGAPLPNVGAA